MMGDFDLIIMVEDLKFLDFKEYVVINWYILLW